MYSDTLSSPSNSIPPPEISTLNDAIVANPVKPGFIHDILKLSVILSTTARSTGGPGGTGTESLFQTHVPTTVGLTLYSDECGSTVGAEIIDSSADIGPTTRGREVLTSQCGGGGSRHYCSVGVRV